MIIGIMERNHNNWVRIKTWLLASCCKDRWSLRVISFHSLLVTLKLFQDRKMDPRNILGRYRKCKICSFILEIWFTKMSSLRGWSSSFKHRTLPKLWHCSQQLVHLWMSSWFFCRRVMEQMKQFLKRSILELGRYQFLYWQTWTFRFSS